MYKKKKGKKKSKRKTRVTKRGKNVHIGVAPGDHVKEEKNEEEKKECPVDGCEDGMIDISVGPRRKVECKECEGEGYVWNCSWRNWRTRRNLWS